MQKFSDVLPNIYKNVDGLDKFKKATRKWKPENCPCRKWKRKKTMLELFINYLTEF